MNIRNAYLDERLHPFWDSILKARKQWKENNNITGYVNLVKEIRNAITGLTLQDALKIVKDDNNEFPDPRITQHSDTDKLYTLNQNVLRQAQKIDELRQELAIKNAIIDTLNETMNKIIDAAIRGRKSF
jgi:predicted RNase H-like nuclease (RuvC/YqgF family)